MVLTSSDVASSLRLESAEALMDPRLISTDEFVPRSLTCCTPSSDNCAKDNVLIDDERSTISLVVSLPVCSNNLLTINEGFPNSEVPLEPEPDSAVKRVPNTALFSEIADSKAAVNAEVSNDSLSTAVEIVVSNVS